MMAGSARWCWNGGYKIVTRLQDVLQEAGRAKVAVGHFNVSDSVTLRAVTEAARELKLPVLVGVSEGEREFIGVRQISALVKSIRGECGQPVYLNADHTHSLPNAAEAARAGFDMILFDHASLEFEENARETRRAVEAIKSINPEIVVEGEIGYIGASSKVLDEIPEGAGQLTTPEQAKEFTTATGVDVLAPAVGNMHGMLRSMVQGREKNHLDVERIRAIRDMIGLPLTLHGGSGTDDDDFRNAIQAGITIVHINTEVRLAWRKGMQAALGKQWDEVTPYKLLLGPLEAVKKVVRARLELFSQRPGEANASRSVSSSQ